MKIPDHLEGKIKALLALPAIVLVIYMMSREKKFSCYEWAKGIKDDDHFEMIYKESDDPQKVMTIYGWDLKSHLMTEYDDYGGWLEYVVDTLRQGDTITKLRGDYCIQVKRKNKAFNIPIVCDKVYTDTPKTH